VDEGGVDMRLSEGWEGLNGVQGQGRGGYERARGAAQVRPGQTLLWMKRRAVAIDVFARLRAEMAQVTLSSSSPGQRRPIHANPMAIVRPGPTAVAKTLSHLLLAGQNPLSPPAAYAARSGQQPSNPRLTEIPLSSWLGSIGRAQDVEDGWKILPGGLSSGLEHNLIAYSSEGVDRCFSVGRNEVGQLGIGYNSQGGTRGLVEGFKGDGILQTGASVQSSYMLLKGEGESSYLWIGG
jgi:hypothetical protein